MVDPEGVGVGAHVVEGTEVAGGVAVEPVGVAQGVAGVVVHDHGRAHRPHGPHLVPAPSQLATGSQLLDVGLAAAEDLHEDRLELVAEDAVDEDVDRTVDGDKEVGDLEWRKVIFSVNFSRFLVESPLFPMGRE